MKENISIKVPKKDCPCKRCIWSLGSPNLINCAKYRCKPSAVLYDSEKCSKFEEEEFDVDEEGE